MKTLNYFSNKYEIIIKHLYIKFIRLLICSSLAFLFFSCTHIYLVRHAEKLNSSPDSPLSELGFQRAAALRDALLNKRIDSIYVTTFVRTQQTADSLCKALGINYIIYNINASEQLAQHLKLINCKNILVVGHSNTIPQMVKIIADQTVSIPENIFNKMFIITIRRWPTANISFRETTYGAPPPQQP